MITLAKLLQLLFHTGCFAFDFLADAGIFQRALSIHQRGEDAGYCFERQAAAEEETDRFHILHRFIRVVAIPIFQADGADQFQLFVVTQRTGARAG